MQIFDWDKDRTDIQYVLLAKRHLLRVFQDCLAED